MGVTKLPKITFFNLPEEKKQSLMHAIKQEFSRVPFYEASITNIIKTARIPRGSFYQYFEDKEDAFFFLLNELTKENKKNFIYLLKKNSGDLFETMMEFFYLIIKEKDHFHFLKNMFLNMTYKIENTFARSFRGQERNESYKELSAVLDKAKLNVSDEKELASAMQIILAVTFRHFVKKFAQDLSIEESMEQYRLEMNLLKKGLSRD